MTTEGNKVVPMGNDGGPAEKKVGKPKRPPKNLKRKNREQEMRLDSFSDSLERPAASSSDEEGSDNEDTTEQVLPPPKKRRRKRKPVRVPVSRTLSCPDMVRVDRCRRLPEYGPKILFFSGGSALRELSRTLKSYTHNSIHLLTPFDSGGSSAEIRRAFHVSAVGDFRNRLVALSDESALGNPEVNNFFSFRLDTPDEKTARSEFQSILNGEHPLAKAVQMPMRKLLRRHLQWFSDRMPSDFSLQGASIGNLVITGCWLEHDKDIVAALYLLWNLLGVKGKVRPITAANLHLRTLYEDGIEEVGQHLMGKRKPPQKIKRIDLVKYTKDPQGTRQMSQGCHLDFVSKELISTCDLIVYPMGSFFGSILANLLPVGVGRSVYRSQKPKIYVPNTGRDAEMHGYTLSECIQCIIRMVQDDVLRELKEEEEESEEPSNSVREQPVIHPRDIVNYVLVDTENCNYCVPVDKEKIEALGIVVMDLPLVNTLSDLTPTASTVANPTTKVKSATIDPHKLSEVLITLGS